MIRKVIDYVKNNSFSVTIDNNYIDIINYIKINYMEDEKISINYDKGSLLIRGRHLTAVKLLDDEVLIKGVFTSIEFRGIDE